MNAADYYGLDELKRACSGFIQSCVNVDTVCALLATAERYIQVRDMSIRACYSLILSFLVQVHQVRRPEGPRVRRRAWKRGMPATCIQISDSWLTQPNMHVRFEGS